MFFKLHSEGKIGYKQLSQAELKRTKGGTTHIGLFGDILTFLPNNNYEEDAMFLYNKTSESLLFSFDRINRNSGKFDAPKIKSGGRNVISVVTTIKDIANNPIDNKRWFLIWFGLSTEEVVTFLFNNSSEEFLNLSRFIDLSKDKVKGRVNYGEPKFDELLKYLENYVNENNIEYISELEVITQTKDFQKPNKKYKPFDIERANELFNLIGRKGELIINAFLLKQKTKGQIYNYFWYNEDKETGLPYDFHLQTNDQNEIFIDVKSTNFKFEQPMIFSNQEIDFINTTPNYNIYRVYDLSEEIAMPKLKICEDSKNLANLINPHFDVLKNSLENQNVKLQTAKMVIKPENEFLSFDKEILLEKIE